MRWGTPLKFRHRCDLVLILELKEMLKLSFRRQRFHLRLMYTVGSQLVTADTLFRIRPESDGRAMPSDDNLAGKVVAMLPMSESEGDPAGCVC